MLPRLERSKIQNMKNLIRIFFLLTIAVITATFLRSMI
jgi:hypothetical protein